MKTFITFIYLISCTLYLFAQPSYYTQTKTFTENDYIYQCDVRESGMVTLYKKGDKWIYTPQIIRSTGEHFIMYDDTPDIIETVITTLSTLVNLLLIKPFPVQRNNGLKDLNLYYLCILIQIPEK